MSKIHMCLCEFITCQMLFHMLQTICIYVEFPMKCNKYQAKCEVRYHIFTCDVLLFHMKNLKSENHMYLYQVNLSRGILALCEGTLQQVFVPTAVRLFNHY